MPEFEDYEDMDDEPIDEEEEKLRGDLAEFDKSLVPKAPKDPLEHAPGWLKEWSTKEVSAHLQLNSNFPVLGQRTLSPYILRTVDPAEVEKTLEEADEDYFSRFSMPPPSLLHKPLKKTKGRYVLASYRLTRHLEPVVHCMCSLGHRNCAGAVAARSWSCVARRRSTHCSWRAS